MVFPASATLEGEFGICLSFLNVGTAKRKSLLIFWTFIIFTALYNFEKYIASTTSSLPILASTDSGNLFFNSFMMNDLMKNSIISLTSSFLTAFFYIINKYIFSSLVHNNFPYIP